MISKHDAVFKNLVTKKKLSFDETIKKISTTIEDIKKLDTKFILENVEKSNAMGRGGSSTLIWQKWSHFLQFPSDEKYLIVNEHEGEPFSIKDKTLLQFETHQVISGIVAATRALGISKVFLAINEKYDEEINFISDVITKLKDVLPKIEIHKSSQRYIAGEETALVNEIEQGEAFPRQRPPYPTETGLFSKPTLIHNVETVAILPTLLEKGHLWFSNVGTRESTGTKLFCISGDVNSPCVTEEEFGASLRKVISTSAGGVIGGDEKLYAVMSGVNVPLSALQCSTLLLSAEGFKSVGANIGTGNLRVFNSRESLFNHLFFLFDFLKEETCARCSPCRIGCKILAKAVRDFYKDGFVDDEVIFYAEQIKAASMCSFAAAAVSCFCGTVENFGKRK